MIPHKAKIDIIKIHIKEETLKGPGKVWGREVKLLNEFLVKYPDVEFWMHSFLGYMLHSFAFLKTDRGAIELHKAWARYQFGRNQKNMLDSKTKPVIIGPKVGEDLVEAKTNQLEWADA